MRVASAAHEVVDHSILEQRPPSVAHLFRQRVAASATDIAYQFFDGDQWSSLSWAETKESVWSLAAGLIGVGVDIEDRVALISTTRLEWVLADLAVMCAGAATTTVYPSTMGSDVAYLLRDSGSTVVFAEDAAQVAKVREHLSELPALRQIVCFDDNVADGDLVIGFTELASRGGMALAGDPHMVDDRIDLLTKDHLATIIYTSGTTGPPKGAELTHDAFVWAGASVASVGLLTPQDLQYLWLPLSHVFGKVLLTLPLTIGFPTAVDGRLDMIVDNVAVIQPTWMGAAPRIFEKVKSKVELTLAEASGMRAGLIRWALAVGDVMSEARQQGRSPGLWLRMRYVVADALVLRQVRDRFGGRIRFFISGSAPLDPQVARWFARFGLLICEGYGLTETAAFTTVNRPHAGCFRFGSIGWPAPGAQVRIADDGEILVRGPGVMRGYHGRPDLTAEVFTPDGFFCTGDIGVQDEQGFVTITDRKKDMFKTSGGKYVAPAHIEAQFKGLCPYVSQFLVIGEGKHYASALVTVDADAIRTWAAKNGMAGSSYEEIVSSAQVRDLIQGYIDELNSRLNRWETIKRFSILERDLSVENAELTPSMKLRRKVVIRNFSETVNRLYEDGAAGTLTEG
ncbi:Long-chain-fatty-acid--CoA ligase FadD15 [Austwickia sp. TVS 96-490-7B]|uniref:AMP-dependent synthetase/ligase n=1 Tax=Austwickia sp. TVS 96-490-7B TaxID=2830843 RepID=UPI001C59C04B|nr:long-chain fatty acid--CoA ligase [Austwickia sp. TVS 96-490-7B]MBW3086167.1 Long-chain-fatty-acid--CoA ligase FadD15 [Austwickia sp. TVS 96-490-7B]